MSSDSYILKCPRCGFVVMDKEEEVVYEFSSSGAETWKVIAQSHCICGMRLEKFLYTALDRAIDIMDGMQVSERRRIQ